MENNNSVFSRFISILFIVMGIFFGIYAFFVSAQGRNVGGTLPWNNMTQYLNADFREANPSDYDIITALYGTGDEGSIYTQNWTGYNSGSCLSAGMNVVYTGNLVGGALTANTIYVVASGAYDITSSIEMAECSALISSGDITLQSGINLSSILSISGIHNVILDNIDVNGNNNSQGISVFSGHSNTLHTIKIVNSSENGLYIGNTTHNLFSDIISSNNLGTEINIIQSAYNIFTNITGSNSFNERGISISLSGYNILDNIVVYGNRLDGIRISNSCNNTGTNLYIYNNGGTYHGGGIKIDGNSTYNNFINAEVHNNTLFGLNLYTSIGNTIQNFHIYENDIYGIAIDNDSNYNNFSGINNHGNGNDGINISSSNYNLFTNVDSYDNTRQNLSINDSNSNTFIDITANGSETAMGVYLSHSSNNNFTGLYTYGNYYAGVHLYNSNNNTGTTIISNSNEGGLYLENSTGNVFEDTTIENNTKNGAMFVSESNNNTLSGSIISGNMNNGIYISNSDNNTLYDVTSKYNYHVGLLIETGNNTTINHSKFNSNDNGINFDHGSGNIISNTIASGNDFHGITIGYSNNNEITSSIINNNGFYGIHLYLSNGNIITGSTLSDNLIDSIYFYNSNNNIISYTTAYYGGIEEWKRSFEISESTGNIINHFSGNKDIYEYHTFGLFQYTIYDNYTQSNNYIKNYSHDSITLTGNTLSIGSIFLPYFDELKIEDSSENYLKLLGINSFSISGNIWDGKIYAPTPIIAGTKLATIEETGTENIASFKRTIEVISGNTYLTMNNGTGHISYMLAGLSSGTYLKILQSIDGNIWTENTIESGCILNEYSFCDFNFIDNFKLFAFGVPTNYSFSGITQTGGMVTSGGYYNTGVIIYFTGDNLSGATLNGVAYTSGDFITTNGYYTFILTDVGGNSTGMSFTIDTINPLVTSIYPTSGSSISTTNTIAFTRSGLDTNISGYTLYVDSTGYTTTSTGYSIYLNNGTYTWYVVATDRAGNTGMSLPATFSIITPLTGSVTITGIMYTGYTNNIFPIMLSTNQPAIFSMTGDITGSYLPPYTGIVNPGTIYYLTLTPGDGIKNIYITFSTGSQTPVYTTKSITLDTTAPSVSLVSPMDGTIALGTFDLDWASAGADAVGLSGYQYIISNTNTFTTITTSGYTTTATLVPINAGTLTNATTYYWYIKSIDKFGNIGVSNVRSFYYSGVIDTIPNSFSFNDVTNADLDEIYISNTVTITGMTPNTPVLASINRGALYISGNMVGTTGYIQNGQTIKIELTSSNEYNDEVSSTLTIGGVSDTFKVTTKNGTNPNNTGYDDIDTDLSNTEKLMVIAIFETLKNLYAGDKEEEFFNTMMLMLEEKMDEYDNIDHEYIALKYLYDIIEQYYNEGDFSGTGSIDIVDWITNGIYTAPNGKKYTITYDSNTQRFTSTNFVVPKYFPTLDTLKYIIDINNPAGSQYANAKPILARWKNARIDGTRQTSPYTAPNRKVFYFFKNIYEKYSSYTFTTERYFDSLNDVKEFIYNSNR